MTLKVFLVEDETYVRDEIKFALGKYGELEIVGEADNSLDAICNIQNLRPDVVFLDIKLGDINGITLGKKILEMNPRIKIVFVTAYDYYAVEGFELDAVDYVLKPFSEDRLKKTVERLLQTQSAPLRIAPIHQSEKLIMKKNQIWKLVDVADIYYFQANGHKITAVTLSDAYNLNYTLRELERLLPTGKFLRVHKSIIVNSDYIDEIIPWFNYTYKIALKNAKGDIFVSRNYLKQFKATLKIF